MPLRAGCDPVLYKRIRHHICRITYLSKLGVNPPEKDEEPHADVRRDEEHQNRPYNRRRVCHLDALQVLGARAVLLRGDGRSLS
jgi:hypothetical protein